ncbi:MAG: response regulator [Methylotenera sp.]|nr:response regulator [Oligoflexia bacterium]
MKSTTEANIQIQEAVPARNKRILIIDDNEDLIETFRTILEMNDFVVLSAHGGEEALALLTDIEKLDLILLDMQMGEMSGPEFLELFEKTQPEVFKNVPVVFLTGMDKIPASKAVGFIRKPMADIASFLEAVERFIETGVGRSQL